VHLAIFLAENQLDEPLLIDLFILFFNSLHVSGTNKINKYIKSGASSWFSARNIARCRGNKTLNFTTGCLTSKLTLK
jgi:hypothetical protein